MFGLSKLTYKILKVKPTSSSAKTLLENIVEDERLFGFYYDGHGKFQIPDILFIFHGNLVPKR